MTDITGTASVTVILADGDQKDAVLIPACGGSYLCPWCGTPVLSPQAWQAREESIARDRERDAEPARPPAPYPDGDAAAWESRGCPSPACVVNMTPERLAGHRAREEARAAQRRQDESLREWNENQQRKRERERDELWERLAAEAAGKNACLTCLRKSSWSSGRPRFVRHRTPDYHSQPLRGLPARHLTKPACTEPAQFHCPIRKEPECHFTVTTTRPRTLPRHLLWSATTTVAAPPAPANSKPSSLRSSRS
jgi:hypothetical protein